MNSFARAQRTTSKVRALNTALATPAPQGGAPAMRESSKKVPDEPFKHAGPGTFPNQKLDDPISDTHRERITIAGTSQGMVTGSKSSTF